MFKKTRKQLTFYYSGIIGMYLIIMTVSFYITLTKGIASKMRKTDCGVPRKPCKFEAMNSAAKMNGNHGKHSICCYSKWEW